MGNLILCIDQTVFMCLGHAGQLLLQILFVCLSINIMGILIYTNILLYFIGQA